MFIHSLSLKCLSIRRSVNIWIIRRGWRVLQAPMMPGGHRNGQRQLAVPRPKRQKLANKGAPNNETKALGFETWGVFVGSNGPTYFFLLIIAEVEMAIASAADYFVLFGDGLIQGYVSKPSLLTLQMRSEIGRCKNNQNGTSHDMGIRIFLFFGHCFWKQLTKLTMNLFQ